MIIGGQAIPTADVIVIDSSDDDESVQRKQGIVPMGVASMHRYEHNAPGDIHQPTPAEITGSSDGGAEDASNNSSAFSGGNENPQQALLLQVFSSHTNDRRTKKHKKAHRRKSHDTPSHQDPESHPRKSSSKTLPWEEQKMSSTDSDPAVQDMNETSMSKSSRRLDHSKKSSLTAQHNRLSQHHQSETTSDDDVICVDGPAKEREVICIDLEEDEPNNQSSKVQPTTTKNDQPTTTQKNHKKKRKRKRNQLECLLEDAPFMTEKPRMERIKSEPADRGPQVNADSGSTGHSIRSDATLSGLHIAMDIGHLSDCREIWQSYCHKFSQFDEADAKEFKKTAFNRLLQDKLCRDKQQLHHIWACDRYDDCRVAKSKKQFKGDGMRGKISAKNQDALDCLDFLVENDIDLWNPMPSNGQTVLHMCIAGHHTCVLNALLKRNVIKVEHLLQQDRLGETPIHSAISGQSFECLYMLMNAFPPNLWIEKAVDSRGNTALHQLCRYSDIEYGQARPDCGRSHSFQCLQKILELLEKSEDTLHSVLAQVNFAGDTTMCVAAKCGVFFEANLLTKIRRFDVCVAIICGRAITSKGTRYVSPLKLCEITIKRIEAVLKNPDLGRTTIQRFESDGVEGLQPYFANAEMLQAWLHFAKKTRDRLIKEAKPKPLHLEDIEQLRKGTKVARIQLCTPQAQKLKDRMAESWKRQQHRQEFECDSPNWSQRLWKTKAFQDQVRHALTRETKNHVRPCLIRNPMHPCSRYGDPKEPHFGLFATRDIASNTVICQYSGLVQRETKESFGENAPYGFKLNGIDSFLEASGEKTGPYEYSYILDAAKFFNEGALINDVRNDLLEDCDDLPAAFEQNCQFAEVSYNGWPHVLLISTKAIEKGQELLTDYSYEYWVRFRNELLDKKVKDLEATVAALRKGEP